MPINISSVSYAWRNIRFALPILWKGVILDQTSGRVCWKFTSDGCFSTKSVYEELVKTCDAHRSDGECSSTSVAVNKFGTVCGN